MKDLGRNFWLYAIGRLVSLIGSGIQSLAIPLYILDLTGSGTIMGTFMVITMLPRILFGPVAGVLGDRFNRKMIMVYMDFARGAAILAMAVLAGANSLTITVLFIFQLLISTFDISFDPATAAMLPDIIESDKLLRGNSILGAINSLSYIIGPALGGILYGMFGIEAVLILNGASYIASAISEIFIRYQQTTEKGKISLKSVFKDVVEGVRYMRKINGLILVMVFAMLSNFLLSPFFSVVFPFFARTIVGFTSEQYGFLQSGWVVGVLIGNVILGTLLSKKRQGNLFAMGLTAETLILFLLTVFFFPYFIDLFGWASWRYFAALGLPILVTGIFNAFVNTPLNTLFQKIVPTNYRSRIFSVISILAQIATPLGAAIYGFAVDRVPVHYLILVSSIGNALLTLVFLLKGMTKLFDGKTPDNKTGLVEKSVEAIKEGASL
ncbi:MAG TPA: MFS transporter [Mesotoga sp.]|jgi:MFS family permease|nr:MFS transporter [Mesotoga sp.]MDI9375030.1 MFS transporter [Thermotogota bacterium]NLX34729.1 MFS transporter [Thermotogaceae bacterium]MDD4041038.1 MFS transporter [Mesotoga sp.]MDD5744447.1 MFS transporter [Mesotoga sp.]